MKNIKSFLAALGLAGACIPPDPHLRCSGWFSISKYTGLCYFSVDPTASPSGPPTSSFRTTPGTHRPSGHTCRHALNPTGTRWGTEVKTLKFGNSLEVQLRICLAMKGTQDQSLLQEVRSCMPQSVPERGREEKERKKCLPSGQVFKQSS